MDTPTFRDIAQVVPAVALAAAGQVAAAALGQCARLLDEHGTSATLLTRHAARSAAYYTGDLSHQVAENAHVYASHMAYQAQRQAQRVHSITDAFASVLEATVQTATSTAQRTARYQARRAATFADDQAIAANYAVQNLVGRLPGFGPRDASSSAADAFDPWANIPPRGNGASTAAGGTEASAAAAAAPASINSTSAGLPAVCDNQGNCSVQHALHKSRSAYAAAAATPGDTTAQLQAELVATQEVLADTVAALEDAHTQLAVKQLTANIFRAVERKAADEQLQQLHSALLQSTADLAAARQQLEAATGTVAALPQQMVFMVQNQMRRAMREGMVELMREALASPEPAMHSAAATLVHSAVMTSCTHDEGNDSLAVQPADSVADGRASSRTSTVEAATDAADDIACTAADQAALLQELQQGITLGIVQREADVSLAGIVGSRSVLCTVSDEDQQSSDDDAFVVVDAQLAANEVLQGKPGGS